MCYLFYKPWEVLFPIVCVDLNLASGGKSDTARTGFTNRSLKSFAGATCCKNFLEIYISRGAAPVEKFPAIELPRNRYYSFSALLIPLDAASPLRGEIVRGEFLTNSLHTSCSINRTNYGAVTANARG